MSTLRLLVSKKCDFNCPNCTEMRNDTKGIPIIQVEDYSKYDQILITGGDPGLSPERLFYLCYELKKITSAKIYVASSNASVWNNTFLLDVVDGVFLFIHSEEDLGMDFRTFCFNSKNNNRFGKTFKVFILEGIDTDSYDLSGIEVVKDNDYDFYCYKNREDVLPEDTEIKKLPVLWR